MLSGAVTQACQVSIHTRIWNAGIVGPWMIGYVKERYGSYVAPMSILAVVNTGAVVYFAVLLKFLPAKPRADPALEEEAAQRLVNSGELESGSSARVSSS